MDTEPLAGDQEGFMWWEAGLETVCRVDVNVLEEIIPHEGVVTLWVVSRKTCGVRRHSLS